MAETAIRVTDVHKSFKIYYDKGQSFKEKILFQNRNRHENRTVLNGVSFEVQKGEAIGLIGQNGCGKSTMLKLLTKIMYPDSGSIEMKGRVSSLIELGAGFHQDMTGKENIYTNASIFGLTRKEIDTRIARIIEFSELGEFIDNPVRTYSSGMYMRLAFAVAINVDADILLIDEILAVGDANFQAKCFNKLREIKKQGATIVIVSHDMGSIENLCNQAIWIEDGQIAGQDKAHLVIEKYLAEMREKRYESTQSHAEAHPPEGSTQESVQNLGSQLDVEIVKVVVKNSMGVETLTLQGGEQVTLEMYYNSRVESDEFNVGYALYTMSGIMACGIDSMLAGQSVEIKRGRGVVVLIIDSIHLLGGSYNLHVAIEGSTNQTSQYIKDYCTIEVVSKSKCVGVADFNYQWAIKYEY